MAFTNTLPFSFSTHGSLAFYDGQAFSVATGVRQPDSELVFFNPGDVGSFSKIQIIVSADSFAGASAFSVFWKGAAEFDSIFDIAHDFWTGVTTSSTETTFTYWATNAQRKLASAGTPTVSDYMFEVPYLAFGINTTGAETITGRWAVFAQRI